MAVLTDRNDRLWVVVDVVVLNSIPDDLGEWNQPIIAFDIVFWLTRNAHWAITFVRYTHTVNWVIDLGAVGATGQPCFKLPDHQRKLSAALAAIFIIYQLHLAADIVSTDAGGIAQTTACSITTGECFTELRQSIKEDVCERFLPVLNAL